MFKRFNQNDEEPKRDYKPQGIVAASRKRMSKRSRYKSTSILANGEHMPEMIRNKMIEYFNSGKYSLSEIARYCGVSRNTVEKVLNKDPELKERYETLWQERIDNVEQSMVELATSLMDQSGAGVIAGEKAAEFLLRYNRKNKYSETAVSPEALKQLPKIVIPLVIPPRDQLVNKPQSEPIDV